MDGRDLIVRQSGRTRPQGVHGFGLRLVTIKLGVGSDVVSVG